MKKMFFVIMLVAMVFKANAQFTMPTPADLPEIPEQLQMVPIATIDQMVAHLDRQYCGGCYSVSLVGIPESHRFVSGLSIQQNRMLIYQEDMKRFMSKFRQSSGARENAMMFQMGGIGIGMIPGYGGSGISVSAKVGNVTGSYSKSNWGGYSHKSVGFGVGEDVQFQTYKTDYDMNAAYGCYGNGSSKVSKTQKKADAKAAAKAYSMKKNNGVVKSNGSVQKTTATTTISSNTVVKEISMRSLMK